MENSHDEQKVTEVLDTSGKSCPMPMVLLNIKMRKLSVGDIVEVISTDAGSQHDIPSWCKRTGNKLLSSSEKDNKFYYRVKKS